MEDKGLVKIHTDTGELTLSPAIVRKYLVNGNGAVSDSEVMMFIGLCRYQKLNPFLREAYLIKYGTQPATIVTGKEAFMKRAMRAKDCRGFKAGVVVQRNGDLVHTDGVIPPGTKLVGGWAEVHREGWLFPIRVEVSFEEYVGRKNDGTPNRMWQEKPATMIRKVALVQALREAFPEDLAGMNSPEEINTSGDLPNTPVLIDDRAVDITPRHAGPVREQYPTEQTTPPHIPEASKESGRRRRNKFQVDANVFGAQEITTCGATPDQLLALRAMLRGSDQAAAQAVKDYLSNIGCKELSFLRADEAEALISKGLGVDPAAKPEGSADTDKGEMVFCPTEGDQIYVAWCKSECSQRQADGWCPALGETPPDSEDLI